MQMRIPPVKPGAGAAHAQIEAWLDEAVKTGRLSRGERLPPERELAARLGVSRMTLRHALGSLEQRGLVSRRVGRDGGTFVAEPKLELMGTAALSDQLRQLGLSAGARVLSARERAAREDARPLGLAAADRVYEIVRVRLAAGAPVALERTVLVADAFPGLLEEQLDGSLYEVMRARFGEAPVRAVERLEAAPAACDEAAALGIEVGEPVLCVERTAYSSSGRAVERGRDAFRADRTRVTWASMISA